MNIEDISQEFLLNNPNIRSVDFEHEWYFVIEDLNNIFLGAFRHLSGIPLPIKGNSGRELKKCISYHDIHEFAKTVNRLSPFERNINTALNFNPKKGFK